MPRQVRPPTVGQMKTGSPSQSTKVKPNMTRGSTSGSKVSTCKTTCYTKVVKNDVLLPNGTKSASPPTTKDSDKQNKHTHAEPESTSLTANRKLKSPQIMKKTLNKVSKSVDNSSRTLKCSSKITSRKEAKPTASRTEGDIPNNIVSELGDSLKQIDEKKKTQIKNNEPLPSSKQTIDKSSGAFKLQSKTSTQPVKTNSNSSVNVDSKTNTDNTRITRNIPIKRNTNVKDKTKGKYNKLSSSPKVTQSDFKPSTSTSSRASSRNGSKSPSPLVVKSSGNNGNTNVQSKCNRSHKSTSEAYYATNKQVVKVDPAQIKTSKQHIGSVTNRTRSRSSTPCSVTSSKSESNSSSTTSSDIKQRSLTSRDLMMKCVDDTCKQVEKKGTSRVSSASLNTVRIPQNVITKSKKEPVSNNDASETARTQAHLKTSQPFSKQKPQVASAQGAKCDSGLGKTHKNTSMPIEQTNKTSVPNVTELKREKGCSKTVVNSPKASQRITQAAMTVTDRLSKLPKSKTRASVNNKDSSSQLMSMAGKQKQSYSTVKQKRIKPILSESSEISTRESKTVHSSIISKKSIPVENHKLLIKSNTGAINKSNKPNIKRNYSESQSEKINEEQISETKKYTRNLHQNNSFEGDGCLHVHSAIDEDHTCTFCQKQEQTVCPCRLQSGVKTSHLSEELSNRNDLGYGLLTKKDFSSEAELISDGYLDGQRIMENNATNSVERGDYSCLTCDSTSNLTNDHLLDYCDICDANICKHTCKTRDTNDQKLDVDCHFINKLNDMSDSRDTRSDFGPCNNEMITSADVTNIKDEITNELMENQQMQVYRGTPCFERQQSHNENSLEHSLTPEGQEDKLTISYVCPNGESESNESDAPLTRKHKQFSVQLDNHYSLLNKHSQTETVSVTSKMISENELMHSEAFSFKSTSGQLHNISFLSDTKCISCKYFLDKCTCTSEKSENKVYLSKSDMNLAHNRHTGMVSSGNLCSNVCTRKSECKTNYYCKTLKMDGFLPGVGILAHLTSCKCNKMQNKLENVVVCGNNFDITHTKLPLQKTQFCSSNDITCHIKASLEDGGFNRNNVDTEINHKDAGLSKHMSLSEIDEKTPRSYVQDIPGSVLQTEHFHRNYSKEDTFETVEESCMHIDGHDTTEPVSMIDHSLQNTNLVQSHSWNIYKTPNAESFVNLLSVNMDNDNKLLLDKREVPTDKLTSTGDLIDGCKVRKSLESSVDPINVDLNEFCLSMGNESCTEYDLPSPESVMVTECPESCETQVICRKYDLL